MASKLLSNEFQKHNCLDYECTTIEEAIHKAQHDHFGIADECLWTCTTVL